MFSGVDIKKTQKSVKDYLSLKNKAHFTEEKYEVLITKMLLGDEYWNHSKMINELIPRTTLFLCAETQHLKRRPSVLENPIS